MWEERGAAKGSLVSRDNSPSHTHSINKSQVFEWMSCDLDAFSQRHLWFDDVAT